MPRLHIDASLPHYAIVAMGVSGCGKSTLATHLAQVLGCALFEGDDFHAAASIAKMSAGHPLDDEDRWEWLDRLGTALGAAAMRDGVAVASCSALKLSYRKRLEQAAGAPLMFVLLDSTREQAVTHLARRTDHYMPLSLLDSQFATLERPVAGERALAIAPFRPVAEMGAETLAWIGQPLR